jgi:hypothetical protein
MPIKSCKLDNKPGYKWGDEGKCYTYTPGDETSRKAAKKKAIKQGLAVEGPEKFAKEASSLEITQDELSTMTEGIAEQLTAESTTRSEKIDSFAHFIVIENELTKAAAKNS